MGTRQLAPLLFGSCKLITRAVGMVFKFWFMGLGQINYVIIQSHCLCCHFLFCTGNYFCLANVEGVKLFAGTSHCGFPHDQSQLPSWLLRHLLVPNKCFQVT